MADKRRSRTIAEHDFLDKMMEFARKRVECFDEMRAVFVTWCELFGYDKDSVPVCEVAHKLFEESVDNKSVGPHDEEDFTAELLSVLSY